MMEKASFRLNRGCIDNVYTLNEIVQRSIATSLSWLRLRMTPTGPN